MGKREFDVFIDTIKQGGTIEEATQAGKTEVAKTTTSGVRRETHTRTTSNIVYSGGSPSGAPVVITEEMLPKYGRVSKFEVLGTEDKMIGILERRKTRLEEQRGGFDTDTSYTFISPETGKRTVALGKTIHWKFFDKPIGQLETAIGKRQEFREEISDLPGYVDISRTKEGYSFEIDIQKKASMEWKEAGKTESLIDIGFKLVSGHTPEQISKALFVGVTQFPRTVLEGLTSIVTGEAPSERGYAESLIAWESGTFEQARTIHKGGSAIPFIRSTALSPAITHFVVPLLAGLGAGLGIGAIKSASVTAGKLAETGLISYASYEIGKSAIDDPVETFSTVALTLPLAMMGYSTGHRIGFGRMEAFLYGRRTYAPGSLEAIRFKEALKVGRLLEDVPASQVRSLDFAKDIMRMTPESARATMSFLKAYPKTVIGGSTASYTQVYGARMPRDIDLLVEDVPLARTKLAPYLETAKGKHLIDISGFDFGGKPGVYHRFGFETKTPKKIGDYLFMRAGEQAFRKGVSSVLLETRFKRHGLYEGFPSKGTIQAPKDIFDFITISQSQISMAKMSFNPITQLKGLLAEKHLARFIDPSLSSSFGKQPSILSRSITRMAQSMKVTEPIGMVDRGGGYIDYLYPKGIYPKGMVFAPVYGGYDGMSRQGAYMPGYSPPNLLMPYVASSFKEISQPPITIRGIEKYTGARGYKTIDPYINIPNIYIPTVKTPGYTAPGYNAQDILGISETKTKTPGFPDLGRPSKRLRDFDFEDTSIGYLFREFHIPDLPGGFNL